MLSLEQLPAKEKKRRLEEFEHKEEYLYTHSQSYQTNIKRI